MRMVYLDCLSGISGDMMLGALLDAGAPRDLLTEGIAALDLANVELRVTTVRRKGFRATKVDVVSEEKSAHRHLSDIESIIQRSGLSESAKATALKLFRRIGAAEALVHGIPVEKVHFHEVGAVDSIVDIVGTAILWDWLAPQRVISSPVPVGDGHIEIAHGRVRVPAPATAELLKGAPIEPSAVPFELTTPTGATFIAEFVDEFGPLPGMTLESIGYGAGDRDLDSQPNLLRLLVGQSTPATTVEQDWVEVLETQIDDQPGEWFAHAMEQLLASGARDVTLTPIVMKKGRPGTLLTVLADPQSADRLEQQLFLETTTIGLRRHAVRRKILPRKSGQVDTPWGTIEGKWVQLPNGRERFAPEYESCREIAQSHQVPLPDVFRAAAEAASLSSRA